MLQNFDCAVWILIVFIGHTQFTDLFWKTALWVWIRHFKARKKLKPCAAGRLWLRRRRQNLNKKKWQESIWSTCKLSLLDLVCLVTRSGYQHFLRCISSPAQRILPPKMESFLPLEGLVKAVQHLISRLSTPVWKASGRPFCWYWPSDHPEGGHLHPAIGTLQSTCLTCQVRPASHILLAKVAPCTFQVEGTGGGSWCRCCSILWSIEKAHQGQRWC